MTKIDWSDETINPLGHGCYGTGTKDNPKIYPYCYAAKMAKRNMRGCDLCAKFIPHTHFEQLDKLKQWKKPKTVFVQSMGDLFGDWVSDEWIEKVFDACKKAPQHRYLFLTKNPKRYLKLYDEKKFPYAENFWFGTTCTKPSNEFTFVKNTPYKCFVSIEPLLEPFGDLENGEMPDWIIIGRETGNRKDKIIPKKEWIENIVNYCREKNVPVFMKNNLAEEKWCKDKKTGEMILVEPKVWDEPLIQEFPWRDE